MADQIAPTPAPAPVSPPVQQSINLIDPDTGEVGAVPQANAHQYIQQGYRPATPEETDSFVNEQKYGGAGQEAITGLEGAAQSATFGLSTAAERALGVPKEDIAGRKEANPGTHVLGQVAGLVGSSLLVPGGGAAGALDMAGEAAVRGLGMGGAGGLAKIGSAAVKGAVENAMVQGGDEVSRMLYQDHPEGVQTAIANVGLAGLIGGGISGGVGVVSPLWKATVGDKMGSWLEAIQRRANGEAVELSPEIKQALGDTAGLGLPPELHSAMSDVPDLAQQFNVLQESKTMPGQNLKETVANFEKSAGDHIVQSLGKDAESIASTGEISHFEAGQQVQEQLKDTLKKTLEPVVDKFEEIKNQFSKIPLSSADDPIADNLAHLADKEGWMKSPGSPELKLYNDVVNGLPLQENLEDLRKFQSNLWSRGRENPSLYHAIGKISNLIEDVEMSAMERAAGSKGEQYLADLALAKSAYRSSKETIEALNDRLRVGKYGGPSTFMRALDEMKPEEVISRLSRPNDAGLIDLLQKEFPEVAQKIKDYQLSKLLGNAAGKAKEGHSINTKTFFNAFDKMTPEMRKFVLPENAQKSIEGVRTLLDAIPKYKSSGTAGNLDSLWSKVPGGAMALAAMLTGHNPALGFMLGQTAKWVSRDAPDAIRLAFLKFLGQSGPVEPEAFKTMVDFIQNTIKGQNMIVNGAAAVFKAGREVLPQTQIPKEKDIHRLDKQLKALQNNPEQLINTGGKTSYYLPDHGAAMGQTAANAVQYLNSLRPQEEKALPLDVAPKVNKIAKATFERALEIAEQPMLTLKNLKEGTLTPEEVTHLKALYPELHQKMVNQLMTHVIDKKTDNELIPYKTKLSLSLFMGQPLDSTMTAQAIQATQAQTMPTEQMPQQPQGVKPTATGLGKLGKMSAMYQTPQQARQASKGTAT